MTRRPLAASILDAIALLLVTILVLLFVAVEYAASRILDGLQRIGDPISSRLRRDTAHLKAYRP